MHKLHPLVMACAVSVTPGSNSAGASQGRLNVLSQVSSQEHHVLFTKRDLASICIPSSEYLQLLDPSGSKTAAELKRMI
jgi:hypothetical protein